MKLNFIYYIKFPAKFIVRKMDIQSRKKTQCVLTEVRTRMNRETL